MTTRTVAPAPPEAVFTPVKGVIQHREIIHLQGETKTGKTDWALRSSFEPIFYLCFDPNGKGIAEKIVLQTGRDIRIAFFSLKARGLKVDDYKAQWEHVKEAWDAAIAYGEGTLVVDTWTELYEECRLAEFGKVEQVRERYYGPINAKLKLMMRDLYQTNLNAILISKMTWVYEGDSRTDKRRAQAWGDTDSEVLSVLELYRDDAALAGWDGEIGHFAEDGETWVWPFHIYVTSCRGDMTLSGKDLTTDLVGLKQWVGMVYGRS